MLVSMNMMYKVCTRFPGSFFLLGKVLAFLFFLTEGYGRKSVELCRAKQQRREGALQKCKVTSLFFWSSSTGSYAVCLANPNWK